MNNMYKDRLYLPIPNFYGQRFSLYEQIVLANKVSAYPIDLWFLDSRTVEKHQDTPFVKPKFHSFNFYQPKKDCPLDWRELAMWFMLWSVAKGTKRHPGKGVTFQDHFTGFEMLLGLGQREAKPLCERLVEKGVMDMHLGIGRQMTWFQLFDCKLCAKWFEEITVETEMPDRFEKRQAQSHAEPQRPDTLQPAQRKFSSPEETLLMLNDAIPKVVRNNGIMAAQLWWEKAVKKGEIPTDRCADTVNFS